jgi:hypothetical protein
MANATYGPKVYREQGGTRLVVASGGEIDFEAGSGFKIAGVEISAAELNAVNVSSKVTLFDDFLGDVIADQWSGAKGSDAQAVVPAVVAGAAGGMCRLTAGDTTVVAESLSSLTHGLNWKANQGGLIFEAKVTPVTSVADVSYFIGLTDVLATTTLEEPATLTTATITYVADDAVGFLFDTAATTDVFYGVAVKATAGTAFASAAVGSAPVAGTAVTLRIEISATGAAEFFINGTSIGTIAAAVTATVALTPIVEVMARTTTVKSIDVDYIFVQANRA